MIRRLAPLLPLLLLLGACGETDTPAPEGPERVAVVDLGAEPAPLELEGAAAWVTPPGGRWRRSSESRAEGQWYVQYVSEDDTVLLRAFVFPVRQLRDPLALLMQAVDTFFRGLGVEGFGMPTRRARAVWGAAAAEGEFGAMVDGTRVAGDARLLMAGPDVWAFAVGYAPADAPAARRDAVRRFTASLEPIDPVFFPRVFRSEADLAATVLKPKGEEPLTGADLDAVRLILEAGIDRRLPLAAQARVRETLLIEARANTAEGRGGYRQARRAVVESLSLPTEERAKGMRALGVKMLAALFTRANEGHAPAVRFATIWQHQRKVAVGSKESGLNVADLASLNEMSAFLASVAADREIRLEGEAGAALQQELREALEQRWSSLSEVERTAVASAGTVWARLRRAWDLAAPEDKAVFRRAVAAELADPDVAETVSRLEPGRPLMAWMHEQTAEGRDVKLVRRAFELGPQQRGELIGLLGVKPQPYAPGW